LEEYSASIFRVKDKVSSLFGLFFSHEDESNIFPQMSVLILDYIVSHPRRCCCSEMQHVFCEVGGEFFNFVEMNVRLQRATVPPAVCLMHTLMADWKFRLIKSC
jgi:hypothetical protein